MAADKPSFTTRVSLIERARAGDASELARRYAPLMYSMARKCGLSDPDAEDVMQQVMIDLLQKLPDFIYNPARGSFRGFLKVIVRRRTADLHRRHGRNFDPGALAAAEAPDSIDAMFDREWVKVHLEWALEQVRQHVHPGTFECFRLCELDGQPIDQVARRLGMSPNQVSQNKRRVLQKIRAAFNEIEYAF